MKEEKHIGLVLRSIDYRDRQKIISLFTPTKGIMSVIVKGITRKKTHLLTLTSPLTEAQYHIGIRRSDLYTFIDGTLLNTHYALRNDLTHIEVATEIIQALYRSQLPGKPSPNLYILTLTYLKHLPTCTYPTSLAASFLLKLLKHDGYLSLSKHCSHCQNPPTHMHKGEVYCTNHSLPSFIFCSPSEWTILYALTHTRNISELKGIQTPIELKQKIQNFFYKE